MRCRAPAPQAGRRASKSTREVEQERSASRRTAARTRMNAAMVLGSLPASDSKASRTMACASARCLPWLSMSLVTRRDEPRATAAAMLDVTAVS